MISTDALLLALMIVMLAVGITMIRKHILEAIQGVIYIIYVLVTRIPNLKVKTALALIIGSLIGIYFIMN